MSDQRDENPNPPFTGGPEPKMSKGELIEYHEKNGTLDADAVRDFIGIERVRRGGRGGR